MTRNCYRCDAELDEPVEENANYVRGEDTKETAEKEVIKEKRHNVYTRAIRDRLQSEHGLTADEADRVISRSDADYLQSGMTLDISDEPFDAEITTDPSAPEQDEGVVRVDVEVEEVEDQKTGLVCPDCVNDEDEVIW